MAEITMYDSITPSQIPAGAAVVAGYVDGDWPTYSQLTAEFPNARHLSIAISALHDADILDVETGDASVASAAGWYRRRLSEGAFRPGFYANASTMQANLIPAIQAAGISRSSLRLWSAHYGSGAHICGPSTCRETSITMDGTQWTNAAMGRNLDESLLAADFFGSAPPPIPAWQEAMMNALPTLQQGSVDRGGAIQFVHRMQALVKVIGQINKVTVAENLATDGSFGASTTAGVKAIQKFLGLTQDGICGPATWAKLVAG